MRLVEYPLSSENCLLKRGSRPALATGVTGPTASQIYPLPSFQRIPQRPQCSEGWLWDPPLGGQLCDFKRPLWFARRSVACRL